MSVNLRRTLGLSARMLRTRFVDQRPFILSHLLTARCNASCATCLWKMPAHSRVDELTSSEIETLYGHAKDEGFRGLVLWGGEPLLRPDAGRVLARARRLGLDATLITNGYFLHERADDVLPHLHRLLVSVDAIGTAHDEIRRCRGLFARVDRALWLTRARYPELSVIVIAVLSRLNMRELPELARYARELGVRVVFQAMNFTDYGFADRTLDLAQVQLSTEEAGQVAASIRDLRKRGYPVYDSGAYLESLGDAAYHYRCQYKKVVLRVEPNGDLLDCTGVAQRMTNVRERELGEFLRCAEFREFQERAQACNRCRDTGVIETSHMWEGRPGAFWNAVTGLR